jgi:hypothetical protein
VEPVKPVTSAEFLHVLDGIERFGPLLANSDKLLHRLLPLFLIANIAFADGFANEFRNGGLPAPSVNVKSVPQVIVKI